MKLSWNGERSETFVLYKIAFTIRSRFNNQRKNKLDFTEIFFIFLESGNTKKKSKKVRNIPFLIVFARNKFGQSKKTCTMTVILKTFQTVYPVQYGRSYASNVLDHSPSSPFMTVSELFLVIKKVTNGSKHSRFNNERSTVKIFLYFYKNKWDYLRNTQKFSNGLTIF